MYKEEHPGPEARYFESNPSPEQAPLLLIGEHNRPVLESLGMAWPQPDYEAAWLKKINACAEKGSMHLDQCTDSLDALDVVAARGEFFGMLSGIYPSTLSRLRQERPGLVPVDTFLKSTKLLHDRGINVNKFINGSLISFGLRDTTIAANLADLDALGFDATALVNKDPYILRSREHLQGVLRNLGALATILGADDPEGWAHALVAHRPTVVHRPMAHNLIVQHIAAGDGEEPMRATYEEWLKYMTQLYINSAESLVVSSLRAGRVFRSLIGLGINALQHEKWGKHALQGFILEHADRPLAQLYLSHYTIKEPDRARQVYERQVNGPQAQPVPIDWQGPVFLGDPTVSADRSAFTSYRKAVMGVPPLTENEAAELNAQLQDAYVDEENEENREERLEHARTALIARHLGVAVRVVMGITANETYRAELVSDANLALVLAARDYRPDRYRDFASFAESRIREALDERRRGVVRRQQAAEDN